MIYRGYGDAGDAGDAEDALSLFEKSSAKAFLPGCSPTKLFLELYMFKRATTQQGSFLPSFFSKKRKSRPPASLASLASPVLPDKSQFEIPKSKAIDTLPFAEGFYTP